MPDITMCKGEDCPLKNKCYRFKATPDQFQYYFQYPPFKDNDCEYFWPIEKIKKRLKK